jgi:hypothetical protein
MPPDSMASYQKPSKLLGVILEAEHRPIGRIGTMLVKTCNNIKTDGSPVPDASLSGAQHLHYCTSMQFGGRG